MLPAPLSKRKRLVTLTASFLVVLTCGSFTPARAQVERASAQVVPGGTVTVRNPGPPSCVDPVQALDADEYTTNAVFDELVKIDDHGNVKPDLALSWAYSHGGTWLTMHLRHGVRFSDGNPLNAAAVRFNLLRDAGPVGKKAGVDQFLGPLKAVNVSNPYTFTMVFATRFRPLITNLANDSLGIIDPAALRKEGATRFCQYSVGSGPFLIQRFGPGGNPVTLVRNRYHTWEPPTAQNRGPPYLSGVTLTPIVSDATAVSGLLSGQIDVTSVPGSQLSRVQNNPNVKLYRSLQHEVYQLSFNTAHAPFNNVAVRRAIAEAVDRNALIKAALNGMGVPAFSPVPNNDPYYDSRSSLYAPRYDPGAARKVLAANKLHGPYTLMTFNSPTDIAAGELIQAELQQVGLSVTVVSKAIPDFISLAAKGNYDLSLNWFYLLDPDVLYSTLHSTKNGGGGYNWSFYSNPALDAAIERGRVTVNPTQAARAYATAQRIAVTNVVIDPLWQSVGVFATRSRVGGFHTDATGLYPVYEDLYVKGG